MSHGRTEATLFSGFEGFGVGARAAGYRHLWGVEWSAKIAGVADRNGFTSIVANVCNVDYSTLEAPYHLHASPVCKNASIAKTDRGEAPEDIATGDAVCRAIEALHPVVFTLENVRGYLHFEAFKRIVATLRRLGYGVTYDVLNSADYGVPQTRERLILRAVQGQDRPLLPIATHARRDKLTPLFDDRLPWVGWYSVVSDLIDCLRKITPPDSVVNRAERAKRLDIPMWVDFSNTNKGGSAMRRADEPAFTVRSGDGLNDLAAIVVNGNCYNSGIRANARVQTFPDTYWLPDQASLTCEGIGNAVPCLLAQRLCEVE